MWFGATIFFTALAVSGAMLATGASDVGWPRESMRVKALVSSQFARVWDDAAARDELARGISRDLEVSILLEDAGHASLSSVGPACRRPLIKVPVLREGTPVGYVGVCAERYAASHAWRAFLALFITGCVLWTASHKIATRLSGPVQELGRVAHELGSGNFTARARLPRRQRHGEMAALAFTINDMAARIERHLAEQRELLAAVSHELRTPLARIRLLTEMSRGSGGGANEKLLDELDREVIEMDALVGDLLASSRMDFAVLSRRPLDAVEAASRALERAGADPAALVVEREDDEAGPVPVQADATLLARALANLIDNARKHGGGVEVLRVRRVGLVGEPGRGSPNPSGGHVAFEVEDHGEGFVAGEEGRVFEPFYRRGEQGSLGLGLALVKRIAEAHGGRAYAANRVEGGARVGIELPLSPGAVDDRTSDRPSGSEPVSGPTAKRGPERPFAHVA
jgi:signal transduction histidine kinase